MRCHALAGGAELTNVRDNLRHASIATTSMYLCGDDAVRAREINQAFRRRSRRAPAGICVQHFVILNTGCTVIRYGC